MGVTDVAERKEEVDRRFFLSGMDAGGFMAPLVTGLLASTSATGLALAVEDMVSTGPVGKFGSLEKSMTSSVVSPVTTDDALFPMVF
jgi:poly(3-hydroxybutyrate) depolymerase